MFNPCRAHQFPWFFETALGTTRHTKAELGTYERGESADFVRGPFDAAGRIHMSGNRSLIQFCSAIKTASP